MYLIDLNAIQISLLNVEANEQSEILRNVKVIFTTPVGTVPFDREFGIDYDILDNPIPIAQSLLTVEFIDKLGVYENRVEIENISFEYNNETGNIIPKVVLVYVG